MAITVPDYDDVPDEEVAAAVAYETQRLQEFSPNLDFRSGVIHDIVLGLHGVTEAALGEAVEHHLQSRSLLEVSKNPELADTDTVNAIASNFGVERLPGETAAGDVNIVLEGPYPVTIPQGAVFTASGRVYTADASYAARLSPGQILSENDRLLSPVGDGSNRYHFQISLTSAEEGVGYRLRRGDRLDPQIPIPRFVSATAATDFSGGFDPESNEELIVRLRDGISVKAPSNRTTTTAFIRQDERFNRVLDISEIGYGDSEQIRYHSIFPVAFGGRRDVYARTDLLPVVESIELVANPSTGDGRWQFSLTRDTAPGFYTVLSVENTAGQKLTVVEVRRSYDLSDDEWAPDIVNATEAAFTRYQTATVTIEDTAIPNTGDRTIRVVIARMPMLADLQEYLSDRPARPDASDILVKGPVPVFMSASFSIRRKAGTPDPDIPTIKSLVSDAVNRYGFSDRMPVSKLISAVEGTLVAGQACGQIELFGTLYRPDGSTQVLRSSHELKITEYPKKMVSRRTVCFYLDPTDIVVTVETVSAD